jgi:hypothetical protein
LPISCRHHLLDRDEARLGIDLDLDEMRGERIRLGRVIVAVPTSCAAGMPLRGITALAHGQGPMRPHGDHAVGDFQLVGLGLHLRAARASKLLDFAGGHLRGAAHHVGGVAGKGADVPAPRRYRHAPR